MTGSLSKARYLLPVFIGLFAFFAISGGGILNVRNVAWLSAGDPAQHLLGWMFFRNAPMLQNPLGANQAFGGDMGTSIVYTDSLPLLAFLFKPFRSVLPPAFQYMGMWILLCFLLQAVMAWKLIEKFSANIWIQFFGAAFFTIAPPFLYRLHGHEALMGQWLILAALWLYFSTRWSPLLWLALLVVGSLVHAYLLVMILAIWVADRVTRLLARRITVPQLAISSLATLAMLVLVMWQAGYFVLSAKSVAGGGFGTYRMNLLAPLQAIDGWSMIISGTAGKIGEDEGFSFPGIGGLALTILAIGESLRDRSLLKRIAQVWPLAAIAALLALYSLSNRLALGPFELLTIPVPAILEGVTNTFRASGRMFWPMFYLIFLGAVYILAVRYPPRVAAGILGVLLVAQTVDSSKGFTTLHAQLKERSLHVSPLQGEFWKTAAGNYRKVTYVPPQNAPRNYFDLAFYAAANNMGINVGAFARTDPDALEENAIHTREEVTTGAFQKDSIYIFENNADWTAALAAMHPQDRAGAIDIFRVLAPSWSDCAPCRATQPFGPEGTIHRLLPYRLGAPIAFDPQGNSKDYLLEGWSIPESWGTWTDSPTATLGFHLEGVGASKSDLLWVTSSYAFIRAAHPSQTAEVLVNGKSIGKLTYEQIGAATSRILRIPLALAMSRGGDVTIELRMPNAISPQELNEAPDRRKLGLGVVWASVSPATP